MPTSAALQVLTSAFKFALQVLLYSGGVLAFDKWESV